MLDRERGDPNPQVGAATASGVARNVERESIDEDPSGEWCYFDETSIRGFQLMHIFLHELGRYHDQMSTRSKLDAARGESYAEQYAIQYADKIWDRYIEAFGW